MPKGLVVNCTVRSNVTNTTQKFFAGQQKLVNELRAELPKAGLTLVRVIRLLHAGDIARGGAQIRGFIEIKRRQVCPSCGSLPPPAKTEISIAKHQHQHPLIQGMLQVQHVGGYADLADAVKRAMTKALGATYQTEIMTL